MDQKLADAITILLMHKKPTHILPTVTLEDQLRNAQALHEWAESVMLRHYNKLLEKQIKNSRAIARKS